MLSPLITLPYSFRLTLCYSRPGTGSTECSCQLSRFLSPGPPWNKPRNQAPSPVSLCQLLQLVTAENDPTTCIHLGSITLQMRKSDKAGWSPREGRGSALVLCDSSYLPLPQDTSAEVRCLLFGGRLLFAFSSPVSGISGESSRPVQDICKVSDSG